jgi:hypothetical protein
MIVIRYVRYSLCPLFVMIEGKNIVYRKVKEREFDGNKARLSSCVGAVRVIARSEAAKQSRRAFASLDCSARLAMTVLNVSFLPLELTLKEKEGIGGIFRQ